MQFCSFFKKKDLFGKALKVTLPFFPLFSSPVQPRRGRVPRSRTVMRMIWNFACFARPLWRRASRKSCQQSWQWRRRHLWPTGVSRHSPRRPRKPPGRAQRFPRYPLYRPVQAAETCILCRYPRPTGGPTTCPVHRETTSWNPFGSQSSKTSTWRTWKKFTGPVNVSSLEFFRFFLID